MLVTVLWYTHVPRLPIVAMCFFALLVHNRKIKSTFLINMGVGIAQWLERRTRDWKVTGSSPCRSGGKMFFSRANFLCWLLFQYPLYPGVTAVAHKR